MLNLLFLLIGCDDHIFSSGAGHSSGHTDGADGIAVIQSNCAGCHGGGLAPNLSGDICSTAVGVPSGQLSSMNYITAGEPENSYLLHKMKGTAGEQGGVASVMPPPGALSEADIKIVEDWIAAGALCEAVVEDTDTEDTGAVDTGAVDTGTGDTGTGDTGSTDSGDTNDTGNIDPTQTAQYQNGQNVVNANCVTCHTLNDKAAALRSMTAEELDTLIINGKGYMTANLIPIDSERADAVFYLKTEYP